jgi:phosphoesterase RecJ-like protein
MRAKAGFDVARAATALGGGGHPLAAGATIEGPLDAAVKRVLAALKKNV